MGKLQILALLITVILLAGCQTSRRLDPVFLAPANIRVISDVDVNGILFWGCTVQIQHHDEYKSYVCWHIKRNRKGLKVLWLYDEDELIYFLEMDTRRGEFFFWLNMGVKRRDIPLWSAVSI